MNPTQKRNIAVSCDAATRLAIAAEWLDSYTAHTEILIISPTAEAADDLYLRAANSKTSWFGIKRVTLNSFAARLARPILAESGHAPASSLSFVAVAARAIHSLQTDGKLSYFSPVANRPGFPVAVGRTLEELRMNRVDVQAIARLARGGSDLATIAQAVEHELHESKLADRATIFRTAIDSLRSEGSTEKFSLPLLLLDLPLRTQLEVELIREMALRCADVLATVPVGDERVASALEDALDCRRKINVPLAPANSLSSAKLHLFADSAPELSALDDSLKLSNWPGEPRECVEIVRRIQAEAERGVPFDQMAVLLNSAGEYRSHLEEAFKRAEIPVYFAHGSTAPDPSGRAMLALLSCAAEGLSARRFAEYLSLGQVPDPDRPKDLEAAWVGPEDELVASINQENEGEGQNEVEALRADPESSSVIEGNLRAPWRWEHLLVDSAVIGGKDRWVRRLDGLANELRLQLDEAEEEESSLAERLARDLRDLDHLRAFALPTIELLDALPEQAIWGVWLSQLRELAVATLRDPAGVLATLADLEPMAPVGPVDLYEVQLVLEPRLRDLSVAPPRRRYAAIFVGPVESARGLAFNVVFIPGLAEKIFPRKLVEDPILPDLQRQEVAGDLLIRRDRLELERQALRLALGAARERAYLSYPRIDVQQSRPRVPSFYALEALRAAEGVLPGFQQLSARAEAATRARLGWPAPQSSAEAIDESEYDLALLGSLVDARPEDSTGSAHYLLSANAHLARALRARFRRWSRKWTLNDGLVDADDLGKEAMARQQLSARAFSATALQHYASCPYRFFLNAVFRLRPREEVAAIEVLDPLTRGALFHKTQFDLLTRLKTAGLLPLGPTSINQACAVADSSLDEVARLYEDRLAPAIPRVWRDTIESIRSDLREWLRRSSEADDGWVPDKFELAFAMDHILSQERDAASVSEPVEIAGGLKLRGSIDLVERHANGKLRVTDHKTGKARAEKDFIVGRGQSLQPLLYALACEELLGQRVESGRLYYCTAAGGYEERVVALDGESREVVTSVITTIGEALSDGFLPAAPDKGACAWCDYRAVCGSREELRSGRKPAMRLAQLTMIRGLP